MSILMAWPNGVAAPVPSIAACEAKEQTGEMDLYRQYTLPMLRRYFRMSVDIGRMPSVLGRECFRARVSSYKLHTFEDSVIFVHDMERCLDKLSLSSQRLLAGLVFLEYSQIEVADALGVARTTILRRFRQALDRLSQVMLEVKLIQYADLKRVRAQRRDPLLADWKDGDEMERVDLPPKKACGRETCTEPNLSLKQ